MNTYDPSKCLLAACLVALAQEEAPGQFEDRDSRRIIAGLHEPSFWMHPHQNVLTVDYSKKPAFTLPVTIDYPADWYAFPSATRSLDIDRLVLAGRDSAGRGVLAWIRVDGSLPTQWTVLDTYTQPGSDFIGVTYSPKEQRLYVLDLDSQAIHYAAFSAASPLLPTSWSLLAHSSQFGSAEDLELRALGIDDRGEHPRISVYYVNKELRDAPVVVDTPVGPTFDVHRGELNRAAIATRQLVLGAPSVPLVGRPSTMADLLRMDAPSGPSVIGSVQLDATGRGVVPVTSAQLVFGGVYGARSAQDPRPTAPFMTPEKRWGAAQSLADGNEIQPLRWIGSTAFVGSSFFRLPCYIRVENPPATLPKSYPAFLLVGDETSEIVNLGGATVLTAQFAFSASLEIYATDKPGFGVVRIPIPQDPLLGGAEVRYQWMVDDGVSLRVSDIAGIMIRSAMWVPPGNETVLQEGAGIRSSSTPELRSSSIRTWLEQGGGRRLTERDWRDIARRIRRG